MNEHDFEDILAQALAEYAKNNDLPLKINTVKQKGFGKEAGLIVSVGETEEFHLTINQTLFEGEDSPVASRNGVS